MPKPLTDNERAYIGQRLREEAKVCLSQYGIRKTTVDMLAKRTGIPKGTFYLFHSSKERLIFDMILQFHDDIQAKLMAAVSEKNGRMDADELTNLLFDLYKQLDGSFLVKLMADGELAFFMGKLPPEWHQEHQLADDFRLEQLLAQLSGLTEQQQRLKVCSAALRGVFLTLLHRGELGEDVLDDAIRFMIRGIVIQLFGA